MTKTHSFIANPPYLNAEHYYGKDSFSHEDHHRLSELLHGIKVTHYENELYNELCKGWQRYEYQSFKGSHKSEGEENQKLWKSYTPILNQLKHGGCSMRWNNLNDFIFWAVSFELTKGCVLCVMDEIAMVVSMGMFRMPLTVFHPKIEGYTAHNYYCINNFKTCHCSLSFLSKLRAIKSGIMVEIIPKAKVQNLIFEGFAN